jgi:hypothetical protein
LLGELTFQLANQQASSTLADMDGIATEQDCELDEKSSFDSRRGFIGCCPNSILARLWFLPEGLYLGQFGCANSAPSWCQDGLTG